MPSNLELFPTNRAKNGPEWVGGQFVMPSDIEGARPHVALWMELPSGKIIGMELRRPSEADGWFARTLLAAMKEPMAGKPRRPSRIRVADAVLAAELEDVRDGIDVVVAPTPELDDAFREMSIEMGANVPNFVDDARLPPKLIGELFAAAERLYRLAPWKFVEGLIAVDVPRFGIEGACLSVIGARGEEYGFLLFPSVEAWEVFAQLGTMLAEGEEPEEIGTPLLALSFDRKKDVSPSVLRAIEEHGWPVAGPKAYPSVDFRDDRGMPLAVTEHEARLLAGCANALVAFCAMHRDVLSADREDSISESFVGDDGLTVRLTYPIDEEPQSWEIAPVRRAPAPGRNDPCHCGSGRKYKKCHLDADRKAAAGPDDVHARDRRLLGEMLDLAVLRCGDRWLPRELRRLSPEESLMVSVQWAAYELPIDGRPLVEHFLETARLSEEERGWIDAQRRAWLGIWEVLSVTAGEKVVVRDLLTGESRTVLERQGSRTLRARDAVLARVVDHDGVSLFCGMHARSLPPFDAAEVVRDVRAKLRIRKNDVPVDRLRGKRAGVFMIRRWSEAVDDMDERLSRPPALANTDGEAFAFITDRFTFDRADRKAVEDRLAAIEGAGDADVQDGETTFAILRGTTVIAMLFVADGALRVETNSEQRAAAIRRTIEEACGDLIRHRSLAQQDPLQMVASAPAPPEPTEEEQHLVRELKRQHYAKWLDESIPALRGKTPRQAARSRAGRMDLDLLLRHIEHMEAALPEGSRFDVSILRDELSL
jgi:hypothetical protein